MKIIKLLPLLILALIPLTLAHQITILDGAELSKEYLIDQTEKILDNVAKPTQIIFYNTHLDVRNGFVLPSKHKNIIKINLYHTPNFVRTIKHELRHNIWKFNMTTEEKTKYCETNKEKIEEFAKSYARKRFYKPSQHCEEVFAG